MREQVPERAIQTPSPCAVLVECIPERQEEASIELYQLYPQDMKIVKNELDNAGKKSIAMRVLAAEGWSLSCIGICQQYDLSSQPLPRIRGRSGVHVWKFEKLPTSPRQSKT